MILFVRETKTCAYVMVIHTPRLCGEPGFRTQLEQREETYIRCREVVDDLERLEHIDTSLPETPYPYQQRVRRPALGVSPPPAREPSADDEADGEAKAKQPQSLDAMLRQALERVIKDTLSGANDADAGDDGDGGGERFVQFGDGEDRFLVQFLDIDLDFGDLVEAGGAQLEEALRKAGFDIQKLDTEDEKAEEKKRAKHNAHEEL